MKTRHLFRRYAALLAVLGHMASPAHANAADPIDALLLPTPQPEREPCEPAKRPAARAVLFGVGDYPGPLKMESPANDANLLGIALRASGVAEIEVLAGRVEQAAFVERLRTMAEISRCGDTLIVYFGGHVRRHGDGAPLLLLSDVAEEEARRGGMPGTVDGAALLPYFRWLRERGVNVFFVWDAMYGQGFGGSKDATAPRHPLDASADALPAAEAGAFFGIFAEKSVELTVPFGMNRQPLGLLSYALASSMFERENLNSFQTLSSAVAREMATVLPGESAKGVLTFEASHPHLPPFVFVPGPDDKLDEFRRDGNKKIPATACVCDDKGRLVRKTNALGEVFEYVYHPRSGKLILILGQGISTEFHYDEQGNLIRAENSDGRVIHLEYRAPPLIHRIIDVNRADNTRRELTVKYTPAGRPREIRLAGVGTIHVAYDAQGEISKVRSKRGARTALQVTHVFQNLLAVVRGARDTETLVTSTQMETAPCMN